MLYICVLNTYNMDKLADTLNHCQKMTMELAKDRLDCIEKPMLIAQSIKTDCIEQTVEIEFSFRWNEKSKYILILPISAPYYELINGLVSINKIIEFENKYKW